MWTGHGWTQSIQNSFANDDARLRSGTTFANSSMIPVPLLAVLERYLCGNGFPKGMPNRNPLSLNVAKSTVQLEDNNHRMKTKQTVSIVEWETVTRQ